jgi:hypothetical protein
MKNALVLGLDGREGGQLRPFRQLEYLSPPLGSYESGFPDEYAFEDWLFRLEGLAEDEQTLAAGEVDRSSMVSRVMRVMGWP